MPLFSSLNPPIQVPIIDPTTGAIDEVWRRYFRAVGTLLSGIPPVDAPYWVSQAVSTLTGERNLGLLATGYLKQVTAAGIAVPSTTPTIPATDLSGTVPTVRLGSGLADATTFLRGDSSWQPAGAGTPGATGAAGPPGWDGLDGLDGIDGLPGAVGASGAAGTPGTPGTPGAPGAAGPAGLMGAPGIDADEAELPYLIPGPPNPGLTLDQTLACASFRM
jgi:hypothetical protein